MNEVNRKIPGSRNMIKADSVSITTTTTHKSRSKGMPQPKAEDSRDGTPLHSPSEVYAGVPSG